MEDIVVSGLCKKFGSVVALNNFDAIFKAKKTTCVMGRSGCGKTTLLNILMGLLKADSGTISGVPKLISAVFQEDRLLEGFSPITNLRFVRPKASKGEIMEHLDAVGLSEAALKPVSELSGGMRRRVAIARAVIAKYDLLILDEPFKGLDETTRETIVKYLKERTAGKTVIMVTHDPDEVSLMGGELINMYPPLPND